MRSCLLFAAVALIAACGGSSSTAATTTTPPVTTTPTVTTSVNISGFAFVPATIQVGSGAVVTWTNSDNVNHNVTFANAAVGATSNFSTGTKTLTMPTAAGTYTYQCTIHATMTGTVQVK